MTRVVLALLALAGGLGSAGAQSAVMVEIGKGEIAEVDFGAAPPAELLFSQLRRIESKLDGRREVGDEGNRRVQKLRQTLLYTEDFTQRILRVEKGRVVELTRKYVRADTEAEVETDRMPRPRKDFREEPFAAVDLYVEWKDGVPEMQVIIPPDERQETDDPVPLVKPSPAMAEALAHAFELPHAFLARSPARRAVGSRWSVGGEALNRIFPRKPAHPVSGSVEVTFVSIRADHPLKVSTVKVPVTDFDRTNVVDTVFQPTRCAVLEVKGKITTRPEKGLPLEIDLTGTLHYSLDHRLIVAAKLTGTQRIAGVTQGDRFHFTGTYEDTVEVELHRKSASTPPTPDEKPGGER